MDGLGEDEEVVGVSNAQFERRGRTDDDGLRAEEPRGFRNDIGGYLELGSEDSGELAQDGLTEDELMVRQDEVENVGAQPTSGEGTDEDVCVEGDSQDTSRKMSSSVRYPWASAKGMMRRRRSSDRERASCLRRASRTTSLRLRPLRSAARSSSFSSSGSRRMVTVEVFM
jgi:hypothetical protein